MAQCIFDTEHSSLHRTCLKLHCRGHDELRVSLLGGRYTTGHGPPLRPKPVTAVCTTAFTNTAAIIRRRNRQLEHAVVVGFCMDSAKGTASQVR